jgi:nitroreductase
MANRASEYNIDSAFLQRWSPRAFSDKPVEHEKLMSLFEAAKWAPSCYNEQPWLFLYAIKEEDLRIFRSILVEQNQQWANKAPIITFLFAKKHFTHNGKPNRWSEFDAGAAWMSLALQAHKIGLITHGMGGFSEEKAYELLNVSPDEYKAIAAIAIGYEGDKLELPPELQEREVVSDRKPLSEVVHEGKF